MVLIITALMMEAKPLIARFKLKKDMSEKAYQVFRNHDMALIVSGVGKIRSAMAAVHLLSSGKYGTVSAMVNIGFCGAGSSVYAPGRLFQVNKITDMDTGFDYYSDVFCGKELPQTALCCFSKPVMAAVGGLYADLFVDMESSGIMEAANKFLQAHQAVVLKIVSDSLTAGILDMEALTGYLQTNLPLIESVIQELLQNDTGLQTEDLNDEIAERLASSLRLTASMKILLLKALKKAELMGFNPLPIVEPYCSTPVKIKTEGKKAFERLIRELEG